VRCVMSDDVLCIIEEGASAQHVAVQGTANQKNWEEDVRIVLDGHADLGCRLHRGFHQIAAHLWAKIEEKPLQKSKPVVLTGHSLGGAVAVILSMIMQRQGYMVSAVTFGQPMVTDAAGCAVWSSQLQLCRVRYRDDPVPLLPPLGGYAHFGSLLNLTLNQDRGSDFMFSYEEQPSQETSVWKAASALPHVSDHAIVGYLRAVWELARTIEQVSPALRAAVEASLAEEADADCGGMANLIGGDHYKRTETEADDWVLT